MIREVAPMGKISSLKEAPDKSINLDGMTVIPGIINAHVHITLEPVGDPFAALLKETRTKTALRALENLKKLLYSGVTFFRDMGAPGFIDIEIKSCLKEGLITGPDFLVSGKVITMTGGHGYPIGRECDGADEVRKGAREQLKAGADIIKIMATGGILTPGVEPGSSQLTRQEMEAAVEEAQKAGKRAAAHAQGAAGIKDAILAGVNSIEHGIFLDDESVELMIRHNTYLVPTLAAPFLTIKHGREGGVPGYVIEKSKKIFDIHRKSFVKAREAGVKIAMGTDAGTPFNYHDQSALELQLMVQCGMPPLEAITASTKNSAALLGIEESCGTIEADKKADLIVLGGNPLEDMKRLSDIRRVYKNGEEVYKSKGPG